MFCRKCGAKNEDTVKFCIQCGAALEGNAGSDSLVPSQEKENGTELTSLKKPLLSKGLIAIVVEAIVLVVLVCGGKYIGDTYYDPVYVAECYFDTLMEGELGEAYDYLDIKESQFLSKEMFKKTYEVEDRGRLGSFTAKEEQRKENAVKVEVTYRLTNETGDKTKQIIMEKRGKKCLFFDDWKVNIGDSIKREIEITAPSGSKVLLDDVELGEKYKKTSEYGQDGYSVDALFCGRHIIKASRADAQDIVQTEYVYPDDDSELLIGVKNLKLKKEKLEQISKNAQEVFKKIVDAKSKQQDAGFLNDLIKHKQGAANTKQYYDDFLNWEDTSFQFSQITVTAMDAGNPQCLSDEDIFDVAIVAEVNVTGKCQYQVDLLGNNITLSQHVATKMYYGYIDEELSLVEVKMGDPDKTQ